MNTTYAEKQLKVAKAAEDQEAAELTLFMRTKLNNERRERIVTTFSQLLRLYAIVMCSCLVVFTPQKCVTAAQGLTCSTEQNASFADLERRNVLAVNFATLGCLLVGELLYYNREIWMIRRVIARRLSTRPAENTQSNNLFYHNAFKPPSACKALWYLAASVIHRATRHLAGTWIRTPASRTTTSPESSPAGASSTAPRRSSATSWWYAAGAVNADTMRSYLSSSERGFLA